MSDEGKVFLAEYCPDGDAQGVQLYRQPRVVLVGIFSDIETAKAEIQKKFDGVNKVFFDSKLEPLRATAKPKGIYLTTDYGRLAYGRIRPIEIDAEVDSFLSIW